MANGAKPKLSIPSQTVGSFKDIISNARQAIARDQQGLLKAATERLHQSEKQRMEDAMKEKKEREEKEQRKREWEARKKKDEEERLAMETRFAEKRKQRAALREQEEKERKAARNSKKAGTSKSQASLPQIRSIRGEEVPIDVSAIRAAKAARAAAKLFEDDEPKRTLGVRSNSGGKPIVRVRKTQKKEYTIVPDTVLDRKAGPKAIDPALAHLSARERLRRTFNPNEQYALNTKKRDTRTIEEVEMDMKAKRMANKTGRQGEGGDDSSGSSGRVGTSIASTRATSADTHNHPSHSSASVSALAFNSALAANKKPSLKRPAPDPSDRRPVKKAKASKADSMFSASEDSEDSYDDEYADGPPYRTGSFLPPDVLASLRRGSAHRPVHDDDLSDDMEADAEEVRREEMRSAKFARQEDADEERRLKMHEEEKRKKKAEVQKKK
ncbi:hypothetical protein BT69DRAFT_1281236 [Atractiella rhizophila]|nr:hypothetical protein BT69DRAFT_1281236 [Atractiella rhizophila]